MDPAGFGVQRVRLRACSERGALPVCFPWSLRGAKGYTLRNPGVGSTLHRQRSLLL